jgi:hypothetical protein
VPREDVRNEGGLLRSVHGAKDTQTANSAGGRRCRACADVGSARATGRRPLRPPLRLVDGAARASRA